MRTTIDSNLSLHTLASDTNTLVLPEGSRPVWAGINTTTNDVECVVETTDKSNDTENVQVNLYYPSDDLPDNAEFVNGWYDSVSEKWVLAYWLPTVK